MVPQVAAGLAEPADDCRNWKVRMQPGIIFADHPAFGGRRRELTASDFVFTLKRLIDPVNRSGWQSLITHLGLCRVATTLREARAAGHREAPDRAAPADGRSRGDRGDHRRAAALAAIPRRRLDHIELPGSFAPQAMPSDVLAPTWRGAACRANSRRCLACA